MPSTLQRAIGAVKDQTSISLALVSNTTSPSLEVAVLKATTHDDDPVDNRVVHEVLLLLSSNKFHTAACVRAIAKRIGRTRNWMVALKSLMLVLRIFQDGDPYFPHEVFHAKILNLASFRDESSYTSRWDFTSFVRTFALYLDERLDCFLTAKLHAHNGRRPSEPVLAMKPAMILDRIAYWQRLLDRAIATRPTGEARVNRLVQMCLYDVVLESFDLYKDISEGLSLILEGFFHLQIHNCVNAYHACAKAAKQFKELNNFYNLCKSIGIGRDFEYPSVQSISEDQIKALQEFLNEQSICEKAREGERSLSEMGASCASLQELINATPQRDEAFMLSETGSVRSLPVSYSMVDLISLWDDSDLGDQQQLHHDLSNNWEVVMAKTLASSPSLLPMSDKTGNFSDNWELILFEPEPELELEREPAAQPCLLQSYTMPPNNYYNPFLVDDPMEAQSLQRAVTLPTIPIQFEDQTPCLGHDAMEQFLVCEQQKWWMNQNNVIAKYLT
ncbi:clathrin coat assembly protein AP180-like [Salvia hispanica]|uniref:clathrin coat assembly protein AP180-like n=1 Tax=Salvia hispanica TaxID=49212 RepID=UPI002009C9EF|nr:clathrin coat assembly protein AP180-like [Salvia hispanica]